MSDLDRFKPPSRDGQVAVLPAAENLPGRTLANAALRAKYRFDVLGIPAATLAEQARAEISRLAHGYTALLGAKPGDPHSGLIIATGHQPVLPHPGIWLKNHLAWRLAQATGASSVNFIVDNDTVDLGTIKVPAGQDGGVTVVAVPFIDCPRGVAAEEVMARGDAAAALAETARLAATALGDTLADTFAATAEPSASLVEFVSRPRRRIEESFGLHNLELPVSRLCRTNAFLTFAAHIIAHADRFAAVYNDALDRHRAKHGITNPVEPTPNLHRAAGEVELPFWVWRRGERRRPMRVSPAGQGWALRDGNAEYAELSPDSAPARAAERLSEKNSRLKVRPRALAMTMFFRLFCCDMFIHGMGGARYERVNDAIIREFFGVEPPDYAAASATLLVKPKTPLPSPEDVAELRQRIRRIKATPERFVDELLPDDDEARELARRRIGLLRPTGLSRRERKKAFVESKKLAARLQERMAPHILVAEKELARAAKLVDLRAALEDRTFPFFLHSRTALETLYELPALRPAAAGGTAQGPHK